MNQIPSITGHLVTLCRRRGRRPVTRGRRLRLVALTFVGVGLGTTLAAPAMAATGPSMIPDGNSVNIVAQGPDHSLRFYWAANGTSTWHPETVEII
jgi:hypothetical protein